MAEEHHRKCGRCGADGPHRYYECQCPDCDKPMCERCWTGVDCDGPGCHRQLCDGGWYGGHMVREGPFGYNRYCGECIANGNLGDPVNAFGAPERRRCLPCEPREHTCGRCGAAGPHEYLECQCPNCHKPMCEQCCTWVLCDGRGCLRYLCDDGWYGHRMNSGPHQGNSYCSECLSKNNLGEPPRDPQAARVQDVDMSCSYVVYGGGTYWDIPFGRGRVPES